MNDLLAEADVPYDKLIEVEDTDPDMGMTDVALIVGTNDIVDPAAQNDPTSPIAGMPILDALRSRTIMIIEHGMSAGFPTSTMGCTWTKRSCCSATPSRSWQAW